MKSFGPPKNENEFYRDYVLSKSGNVLKFIYSEKATKFCEISTVDLSYVLTVKSTVEISQKFVAFSEYMNFKLIWHYPTIAMMERWNLFIFAETRTA